MKNGFYKIIFFSICCLLIAPSNAETLTFACSEDSDKRSVSNLMRDLTEVSVKAAGYDVKFIDYPWARAISMMKHGKITGSHCLSYSNERKTWAHYLKVPFLESKVRFFKNAESDLEYESLEQLLALKIAVTKESFIAQVLGNLKASNLEYVYSTHEPCHLLTAGRVDLIAYSATLQHDHCFNSFRKQELTKVKIESIGPSFSIDTLQLGFSKNKANYQQISKNIYGGFIRLINEGKIKAIYEKYDFPMPESIIKLHQKRPIKK